MAKEKKYVPLYDLAPLSNFEGKGLDFVPVCSWLRLCSFNTATMRWHIPMRNAYGKFYFVFENLRKRIDEFLPVINRAMGEARGGFADYAGMYGQRDWWLVCDKRLRFRDELLATPEGWSGGQPPVMDRMHIATDPVNDLWVPPDYAARAEGNEPKDFDGVAQIVSDTFKHIEANAPKKQRYG